MVLLLTLWFHQNDRHTEQRNKIESRTHPHHYGKQMFERDAEAIQLWNWSGAIPYSTNDTEKSDIDSKALSLVFPPYEKVNSK